MALYSPSKITVLFAHFMAAASGMPYDRGDPWNFKVVSGSCTVQTDEWGNRCVYSDGAVVAPLYKYDSNGVVIPEWTAYLPGQSCSQYVHRKQLPQ